MTPVRHDNFVLHTTRALALALLFVSILVASPSPAQVLGPVLERHTLETGYTYKWYERDFETGFLGEEDWSTGAFYFRFGACRWATISFEGGIWTVHHEDFEGIDYRRYVFGGGLTARCWERSEWRVDASAHYSEIFDHDRSENQLHKNARDITVALQVERLLGFRGQPLVVWAGPAIVYNQSRQYPWQTTDPVKNDTSNNLGLIVGVNATVFERLSVFSQVVYADTFQPRLGVGIRF